MRLKTAIILATLLTISCGGSYDVPLPVDAIGEMPPEKSQDESEDQCPGCVDLDEVQDDFDLVQSILEAIDELNSVICDTLVKPTIGHGRIKVHFGSKCWAGHAVWEGTFTKEASVWVPETYSCENQKWWRKHIAMHEILHTFGAEHIHNDPKCIMYVGSLNDGSFVCEQTIKKVRENFCKTLDL